MQFFKKTIFCYLPKAVLSFTEQNSFWWIWSNKNSSWKFTCRLL